MRAALAVGSGLVLAGTAVAFAMPPFKEGAIVATSEEVAVYSLGLDRIGGLAVRRASAIEVTQGGTTWVLSGRRLRSFAADGALLSDTRLPSAEDDDDDDESEETGEDDDDSEEHVALAAHGQGVAVGLDRDLFLLSPAGDVTAEADLPHHAVAAGFYGTRLWVAHKKGITGFDGSLLVSSIPVGSRQVRDLSIAANGDVWVALGKEVRVFSLSGVLLRTRAIDADLVSTTADGAWIARDATLTRLDAVLQTVVTAPAFPRPSKLLSLSADPRDGSVFAASKSRVRHVGPAGELLADAPLASNAKVKAQHAVALRLDRVPPTLSFLSPATGTCTGDARIPLVVAFDDVGTGPDPASLSFFTPQGPLPVSCVFIEGGATCAPVSRLPEQVNVLHATIGDRASAPNVSLPSGTNFIVDAIAPAIVLADPRPVALTNVAALSFGGTVSEVSVLTLNGAPVAVSDALTWNASVTLVEGMNVFELLAKDCANVGRLSFAVVLDTVPPAAPDGGLIYVSESIAGLVQIRGEPGSAEPGTTVTAINQRTGASQQVLVRADGSFDFLDFPAESGDSIALFLADPAGNIGASSAASVPGTVGAGLPPDPSLVAPPFDPSLAGTDFFAATSFLFTGADPIQTGVAPGAIAPERIVVLRGRVQDASGLPIAGARISFVGRPEYGQTLSRADGAFDLAANGGGDGLLLSYVAPGFLQVQRRAVGTPWRDYVILPDVVLTAVDPAVSAIDFSGSAPGWQVHLGSGVTDERGFRRNAVFFPPAIMGDLTWNDGRREPLFLGHVHSTEFTVGPSGEKAMPGDLPPTSAYTWSAEYSTEEERDSDSFVFSQPIYSYLIDDFLLVEPGTPVPLGSWDRTRGAWVPEANGLVVRLQGVSGGLAMLDVDGTGAAASETALASLGITPGEREQVALLFPVGATLWRMPLAHFTQPLDGNFGRGPSPDAVPLGDATPAPTPVNPCPLGGSVVEAQTQVLRESIPVQGTPFSLNWTSRRVFGREAARAVDITVSGPTVPASLLGIEVTLDVAGRHYRQSFPPLPNQTTRIVWDGRDAYGRLVQGEVPAKVTVGARYPLSYGLPVVPVANAPMFGQPGTQVLLIGRGTSNPTAEVSREFEMPLGYSDARGAGLAGWTLSAHHQFDSARGTLFLGTGEKRAAFDVNAVTTILAGTGVSTPPLSSINLYDFVSGPDGSLFVITGTHQVWKIPPGGTPALFAGSGGPRPGAGDGGPAVLAYLNDPRSMALGPDGSLYIGEHFGSRIRRVRPDGIIETFAGTGIRGVSGDGGPATAAQLMEPTDLVVGPDGSVYFSDSPANRVRRIGPDGRIWPWAGTGGYGDANFSNAVLGDGGPATQAVLFSPQGLALAPDGSLLIADEFHFRIRSVGVDGIIRTIAGGGQIFHCEGCRATDSRVPFPEQVGVRPDGTILFSTPYNSAYDPVPGSRIRQISTDGRLTSLNDSTKYPDCYGPGAGSGRPVGATCIGGVVAFETLPNGDLLLGQSYSGINFVRRIAPVLAGYSTGDSVVPSADARQLFIFDVEGRHKETRDALTGVTELWFGYDGAGRLSQVTDAYGNVTRVERGAGGVVTALIAPGGQRTALGVDLDGYLSSVANDAGETFSLSVGFGGLVEEFRRPRGNATRYLWDRGFLSRWEDAAGGFQSLTRTHTEGVLSLAHGTAEGRLTTYRIEGKANSGAGEQRTNTFPDGTAVAQVRGPDELLTVSRADGTRSRTRRDPDPRFGMKAAFSGFSETRMPSGLAMGVQRTRSVVSPSGDVLAPPTSSTNTVTVGATGRTWTTTYAAGPPRTRTSVSAEGRTSVATLDALGRVVRSRTATLAPVTFAYRADGLLASTVHGEVPDARSSSMSYDARRQLASVTDALGRTTSFERDLSGRVTRQVLSDGREILTSYDANGNVTSVTPPSRPEHRFTYTPVDLQQSYDPPDVTGATPGVTNYAYDLDRRLVRAVRPDGAALDLAYRGPGQKLSEVAHAASTATYSYEPGTGKLASIAESATGSRLSYAYDGSLLLSETMTGPIAGQVSNAFDADFRVREERVNGAHPIAIGYDRDSAPTQVGELLLSYDPATGLLGGTTLGAVSTARANNAFAEPVAERAQVGAAEVLAFGYTRDALGRILELRETIDGVETPRVFTYDSAGRLTNVHANGLHVAQWTYDGNSNRLSATSPLGTVTAEYDLQDRLVRHGDAFFAYSANGELTTRTDPSGTTSYAYDALGNLRHVGLPDGRAIEYLIDARNRRTGKKIDGVLVQGWLYRDQLEPVAELDGAGNVVSRFVYATKGHAPDYLLKDGRTYRVLSDHLGSPRMVVDVDTGAVVQRMDFDAWGVVTLDTNPGWQPFGFAGGLWDADTGLTRFGARDYAAAEGRWTAKDLLRFVDGTNAYGYSIQDPINRIDPNGEMSLVLVGAGGVGVALGVAAGGTAVIYCRLNPEVCADAVRDLADDILDALKPPPKPEPLGPTIVPGEPEIDPDSTCEADPRPKPEEPEDCAKLAKSHHECVDCCEKKFAGYRAGSDPAKAQRCSDACEESGLPRGGSRQWDWPWK